MIKRKKKNTKNKWIFVYQLLLSFPYLSRNFVRRTLFVSYLMFLFLCFLMYIFGKMALFLIYLHYFLLFYYQWLNDFIIKGSGKDQKNKHPWAIQYKRFRYLICQKLYDIQSLTPVLFINVVLTLNFFPLSTILFE